MVHSKTIKTGYEVLNITVNLWKSIKKKINQKFKDDVDGILGQYLIPHNFTISTTNDLIRALKLNFGKDVQEFFMTLLINKVEFIKELKKKGIDEDKYLMYLHSKYSNLLLEAKTIYDFSERWKLLNTDLVQSKTKGFIFRTKIIRYDNNIFYFESLLDDYFILLDHFIKRLGEVSHVEPLDKFLNEIGKIKSLLEDIKQNIIKRQKKK